MRHENRQPETAQNTEKRGPEREGAPACRGSDGFTARNREQRHLAYRQRSTRLLLLLLLSAGILLPLLTACRQAEGDPYLMLLDLTKDAGVSLPSGVLYSSTAKPHEEGYMPPSTGERLYNLRGYSELRHAACYALYLALRSEPFFEAALFLAEDAGGVSEISEMCHVRGDYLTRQGAIEAGAYAVIASGRYVAVFYGVSKKEGERLADRLFG